ncbi:MAG: hypothetical protein KJ771_06610 [Nanoarchaeota archaeon]|nr:hypothetical protein [Nanoarchaeota archaeon]
MIPEYQKLTNDSLFKDWQEQHPEGFLAHLFCQLNPDLELISNWEVGYFNPKTEKITIFVVDETIQIKPEDEVFKKPNESLEKLNLAMVKVSFEQALTTFKDEFSKLFPSANLGDGFIILQMIKQKVLWNFTFMDKRLKFLNLKINAQSGKVEEHQEVELIAKK